MKLKVAVVLSGIPRTFRRTYNEYVQMLNGIEPDVYIFSWEEYFEKHRKDIESMYSPKKITLGNWSEYSEKITPKENYLKSLKWDKTGFKLKHFSLRTGLIAQWYGVKQCFESIEGEYDYIIRQRFDWRPLFKIKWNYMEENNGAVCYSGQKVHGKKGTIYSINDMWGIGNQKNMNVYCHLYDDIMRDRYVPLILKHNCLVPEFILACHMLENNIPTVRINEYGYKLVR